MPSLFVHRSATIRAPRGTFTRQHPLDEFPHLTYAALSMGERQLGLADVSKVLRGAPDSTRDDMYVDPTQTMRVGKNKKLGVVSIALSLTGDKKVMNEFAYFHREFNLDLRENPHITLVKRVPLEYADEVQERIDERLEAMGRIALTRTKYRISQKNDKRAYRIKNLLLVGQGGLEPPLTNREPDFESSASTNSATSPSEINFR